MEDEKNTERLLEWFDKKKGWLVGEEEVKNLSLDDLRSIFGVTDVHPDENTEIPYREGYDPFMVGFKYVVTEEHAKALQPYFKHKIDLNKYEYLLAAYEKNT